MPHAAACTTPYMQSGDVQVVYVRMNSRHGRYAALVNHLPIMRFLYNIYQRLFVCFLPSQNWHSFSPDTVILHNFRLHGDGPDLSVQSQSYEPCMLARKYSIGHDNVQCRQSQEPHSQ